MSAVVLLEVEKSAAEWSGLVGKDSLVVARLELAEAELASVVAILVERPEELAQVAGLETVIAEVSRVAE